MCVNEQFEPFSRDTLITVEPIIHNILLYVLYFDVHSSATLMDEDGILKQSRQIRS